MRPVSDARWREIKRLLIASEEVASDQLSEWLERVCGSDTDLRREIESLLGYEDDAETLGQAEMLRQWIDADSEADDVGMRVGIFRLTELLGRGGMGEVYLAEREEGFEQRVALKLLRRGLNPRGMVLERFHQERQILARLEHAHIARLIDGGTSEDGRPYLVMELVEGEPIDAYCDRLRLSINDRLRLILQVCEALQFAHRNLIVHRDLKPGNILVTADGTVKLLDFGIAKLLGDDSGQTLAATADGQQPMTLRYASPEQLRNEQITTGSDVYSLGVVMHELLTGCLPYGLEAKNSYAVIQAVCQSEPRPLSQAVHDQAPDVARQRRTSPKALKRQLRGDINAIALKMLRKRPEERYASVEQLANDIRRHLSGLPVSARKGTWLYLTSRYIRRHRVGLGFAVLCLAFVFILAQQLERTERQRHRAVRISTFLVELFRAVEPDREGEEPEIRDLIALGQERLQTELEDEPEIRAELLGTLGQVSARLGNLDDAANSLVGALASLRRIHSGDHPDIARTLNDLAVVRYQQGAMAEAEASCRESLAMRGRLGLDDELHKPRNTLAAILMLRGRLGEAEEIYREVLADRRKTFGDQHPNVATSLRSVATVLYLRGDFDEAEPLLRQALEIREEAFGRDSPAVATTLASLGRLEHAQGNLGAARGHYIEALTIRRNHLGPEHLHVATLEVDLAALHLEFGEVEAAGQLLQHALPWLEGNPGESDWQRAEAESIYGAYLLAQGQFAEARPRLESAYRQLYRVRGPNVLPTRQALRRLEALGQGLGTPASDAQLATTGQGTTLTPFR